MKTQLIGAANRIADRGTRGPAFVTANSGSRSNRTIHIDADGLRERAAAVHIEGIKPGAFSCRPASAAPAPVVDMTPVDESDATASRKTTLRCAQAALTSACAERDRLAAEMNDRIENATIDAHVADTSSALELDKFSTPDYFARRAILLAWVDRIPAADKPTYPLPRLSRSRPCSTLITMSSPRR